MRRSSGDSKLSGGENLTSQIGGIVDTTMVTTTTKSKSSTATTIPTIERIGNHGGPQFAVPYELVLPTRSTTQVPTTNNIQRWMTLQARAGASGLLIIE